MCVGGGGGCMVNKGWQFADLLRFRAHIYEHTQQFLLALWAATKNQLIDLII